ncbi:MAG TPA: response regulator transcription factor [Steroidobacteraceae bacterium]|jgi:DNA-binding NarL/FixJ family response regulator|nr:response regulator transcription factor [Steroidobacteraceae bacterium]
MTEHGTRLIIIDDHPLVREGLKQLLAEQPDFQIAGEASNAAQARQLIAQTKPDVAVLDLTLGQDDGIELTRWIRENYPDLRILILSMQEEALYAERLLRLGVSAYVMKSAAETDFLSALRKVARGQRHLSPEMNERLLSKAVRGQLATGDDDPVTSLTHRELQVFKMIGSGVSTREIADHLQLSMKTIDAHRRHMREKLNLRSTNELMRYAARWVAGHPSKESATLA